MSKIEQDLDTFFNKGVFIPTKTILLVGEVSEEMFIQLIKNIHALDSVTGNITVKLMSEGGDVCAARAIYDAIKACKNYVTGIAYGEVSSSASVILQAFDHRIMTPSSKLMVHIGQESAPMDHPKNVESLFKTHREDQAWMENIYLSKIKEKKPRYSRQKLQEMLLFDTYLTPKQALEYNLIDAIGDNQ